MLPHLVTRPLIGAGVLFALATVALTQHRGPYPPVTLFHQDPPATFLGTISGRVTHDDGTPAPGVAVTAFAAVSPFQRYDTGNPNRTYTDSEGRYILALLPYTPTMMNGPLLFDGKHYKTGYTVFAGNARRSEEMAPYVQPPSQDVDPARRPDHTIAQVNFVLYPHSWRSVE